MGLSSLRLRSSMLTQLTTDAVVVRAPAKVNLFLELHGKRTDGYHELATLMVAVSLYDTLELRDEPSGRIALTCDDPALSAGPENLVHRAAELLRKRTGSQRGARIGLNKRIPQAAGLAGGSSDAAAALDGLNRLWQLGLSRRELAALGAELGSDVAFFFATPAAWCTGRGEIVTAWPMGRPLHLLLVCPDAGLSTADVYRHATVPSAPESGEEIRRAVARGDWKEVGLRLHNRLQPPAEKLCPEVAALHARLRALRPTGQAMSGSGTALFAVCRDRRDALRLARRFRSSTGKQERERLASTGSGVRLFLVRSCD
ncbi:MAG: 4-(cytidine 5'-diphospho)-2-C-methyl-D-erythritol kinase [Gemmataceae bacterium]|nr:4-(cytidine 5'-diphospho)-2-C-methyl-D-erythritol kinase [Gemmataceae bacterium]